MYETLRIVEKIKPRYVLWENVKNILSKTHRHNFESYLKRMEELGYTNYYQVLNAKDYGIPQNRERVYTISILGNTNYEFPQIQELKKMPIDFLEERVDKKYDLTQKNIEHYQREFGSKGKELNLFEPTPTLTAAMGSGGGNVPYFEFPPKQSLELRLKDMLEDKVDEKYYLSDKMIKGFEKHNSVHQEKGTGFIWKPKSPEDIASCLRANAALCPTDNTIKCVQVGQIYGTEREPNPQAGRIYSADGISPTMDSCSGGNRMPKVLVEDRIKVVGNYMPSNHNASRIVDGDGLAPTVTENHGTVTAVAIVDESVKPSVAKNFEREKEAIVSSDKEIYQCECESGWQDNKVGLKVSPTLRANNNNAFAYTGVKIRKLTPKECWRLMGFDDEDFEKAAEINSNTQLYKQAGNSIVVNVLEKIFENLLKGEDTNATK